MSASAPTPDQARRLDGFAAAVRCSPHNLVSRRAAQELEARHIPEAVRLARLLPGDRHRLLDVGSGGGLPGLIVAIMRPDLEVHLLDATRKKATFLQETAQELGVEVRVHHGRAEDLAGGELAGTFDLVTARAVAPLRELLGLTLPFLAPDGVLWAVKGDRWAEELAAAQDVLRRLGGVVLATPTTPADAGPPPHGGPRVLMIGRGR